jgi:hypothetical protein
MSLAITLLKKSVLWKTGLEMGHAARVIFVFSEKSFLHSVEKEIFNFV